MNNSLTLHIVHSHLSVTHLVLKIQKQPSAPEGSTIMGALLR